MSRIFALALLFLMIGISLGRDASDINVEPEKIALPEAEYEGIIQRYLNAKNSGFDCDCAAPTAGCEQICNAPFLISGEWCGTPALYADMEISTAMDAGAAPKVIAEMIEAHPNPFAVTGLVKNRFPIRLPIPN